VGEGRRAFHDEFHQPRPSWFKVGGSPNLLIEKKKKKIKKEEKRETRKEEKNGEEEKSKRADELHLDQRPHYVRVFEIWLYTSLVAIMLPGYT
jgi:hypothetical protein